MHSLDDVSDHDLHRYYSQLKTLHAQITELENSHMTKLDGRWASFKENVSRVYQAGKKHLDKTFESRLQEMQKMLLLEYKGKIECIYKKDENILSVIVHQEVTGNETKSKHFDVVNIKSHYQLQEKNESGDKVAKDLGDNYSQVVSTVKAKIDGFLGPNTAQPEAVFYKEDLSKYCRAICAQYKTN